MGKRTLAAIFAMALLQALPARAEDCRLVALASFDIGESDAVVIPVRINGTEEHFLVDTGGFMSTISPGVIDALHLETRRIENGLEIYMADGTQLNKMVTVDELHIGIGTARHVPLLVQPQKSRAGIEDFAGTLAPDFLPNFDLDFDFGHRKLNLISPKHCEGRVIYWADSFAEIPFRKDLSGHIVIPVTLDGVQTTAMVDTGASRTTMSESMANRQFDLAPDAGLEARPGATDASLVRYAHRFKTLDLGGVVVANPLIGILPDETKRSFYRNRDAKSNFDPRTRVELEVDPMLIGLNVLRKLHLYIDYKAKKLYITAAAATHDAPPQTTPSATQTPAP